MKYILLFLILLLSPLTVYGTTVKSTVTGPTTGLFLDGYAGTYGVIRWTVNFDPINLVNNILPNSMGYYIGSTKYVYTAAVYYGPTATAQYGWHAFLYSPKGVDNCTYNSMMADLKADAVLHNKPWPPSGY